MYDILSMKALFHGAPASDHTSIHIQVLEQQPKYQTTAQCKLWMGLVIEFKVMPQNKWPSSQLFVNLTTGLLLQAPWESSYKVWEKRKKKSSKHLNDAHLEIVLLARPKLNTHLCARHKDQWFHSHFYCPLVKLLLCTLTCSTVLSIQIIPGSARSRHFLVRRNKWQMDSSV